MNPKSHALPALLAALALASCGKGPSTPSTPGLLCGTVVTDSLAGTPLAGAKVVAGATDSAVTGADGKFSFSLLQGRYDIQVSKDGYYGVAASVPVLSRDTTRITVYTHLRPWTPGTGISNINDYRHNSAYILWNGLLYLVGGRQGSMVLNSTLTYSPSAASWPASAVPMLTPGRELSACAVLHDTLFLFGGLSGSTASDQVLRYGPAAASWAPALTPMPAASYAMSAAAFGDSVFLFGGYVGGVVSDIVRVYRPSADTAGGSPWSITTSLPSPRAAMSCAVVGGQAYLFGGLEAGAARSSSFRFNPANGAWATMSDMPAARAYAACASIGNRIFLFGGLEAGAARNSSLRYDIAGNSWTAVSDLPLARYGAAAVAYGDRIHVVGGFDGANSLGLVEIYNPAADLK